MLVKIKSLFLIIISIALLSACDFVPTEEPEEPDLTITSLSISSWDSTSIEYTYTIENTGNFTANIEDSIVPGVDNILIQAFLSNDTSINSDVDLEAGTIIFSESPFSILEPGESYSDTLSATVDIIPSATPYLILKVDYDNIIDESNESNNILSVQLDAPDLVVSSLSVTSWDSTSIEYTYTIENAGNATAILEDYDNIFIQAFLSVDTIINSESDLEAGTITLSESPFSTLEAGDTFTGTINVSVDVLPSVTPYLILKVDYDNIIDESNESNNTLSVQLDVPDLIISSLIVASWDSGHIAYSYTIQNIGTAPAFLNETADLFNDNVILQTYLSADTVFENSGDMPTGYITIVTTPPGTLLPGETYSGENTATITVDISIRSYFMIMVDYEGKIIELNESNNVAYINLEN